ncbi:hemolytic protein HlpA [Bacteroidia bacterium]|nr:hemolytic protein HlpA [Bacteroidia bacterium]
MQFETPVLFLIFNRADTTQQVFDAIRERQPKYLYVAADGPRPDKEGEAEKCQQTRDIIKQVDWDCEVKTLFRDENLGCGLAVSSAITWFFENVEQGIILEDDCLPHPDFFMYCRDLLDKYKDNEQIMFVGGCNFQQGVTRGDASYYFSAFALVWGWASWRSAWKKYRYDLSGVSLQQFEHAIRHYFCDASIIRFWKNIFRLMQQHKIDTWDFQWAISIWFNRGLTIIPNKNLVSNIGFGEDATHTTGKSKNNLANLPTFAILPLKHPNTIEQDKNADVHVAYKFNSRRSIWKILKTPARETVYFLQRLMQKITAK